MSRRQRATMADERRALLRHLLATLAYRTQKALRDAPSSFGTFEAGRQVRTPIAIVRHMTSLIGYTRTFFVGGDYRLTPLADLDAEVSRFHDILEDLAGHLAAGTPLRGTTEERLIQGPLADALTHAGQLALLRRLSGSPVPPERFIDADIDPGNVGPSQAAPESLKEWPEAPDSDD